MMDRLSPGNSCSCGPMATTIGNPCLMLRGLRRSEWDRTYLEVRLIGRFDPYFLGVSPVFLFFFCSFLSEPSILTDADSRQILIKPGLPKLDFVKRDLRDRWD